jgi:hypothetical protein
LLFYGVEFIWRGFLLLQVGVRHSGDILFQISPQQPMVTWAMAQQVGLD